MPKTSLRFLFDRYCTGKEIAVCPFDPRPYRREEARLTIFRVDKVQNLLRSVSPKHDYDLMESLQENKCQYGAGPMTVAKPASRRFGAVIDDSITEHHEKGTSQGKVFAACRR